jgi:hypothetical protein
MVPIPLKPSDTLVERIREVGPDVSKFGTKLHVSDSVAAVFPNHGQISTPIQLDVIVRFPGSGKWQVVNSPYHSVNLVLLLP